MKTTTKTSKNQKFSRGESVEAIETISFSLITYSMVYPRSSLSQWELSLSGLCYILSKETRKITKNFKKFFEILLH